MPQRVTKIGVFYDGNYLYHVSNYYAFYHKMKARLSIAGLHSFIRRYIATNENTPLHMCQVVDAHYFRGRYTTPVIEQKGWLRGERVFEDVLMFSGVTTHYWPMKEGNEKSVDVALALEALELSLLKSFDICVLIAGDGDYSPLVRKLNMTGARVMVLGWDFEYKDDRGIRRETRFARALMAEASYPVDMSVLIEANCEQLSDIQLFVGKTAGVDEEPVQHVDFNAVLKPENPCNPSDDASIPPPEIKACSSETGYFEGRIVLLNQGWGFIATGDAGVDIFFCYADIKNATFDQLKHEDRVRYTLGSNEKGPIAKEIELLD